MGERTGTKCLGSVSLDWQRHRSIIGTQNILK